MSNAIQPGYSWVSPYLMVTDVDKAIKFYHKAFAFEKKEAAPGPDGTITHAELTYQGQTLMLGKAGAYGDTGQPPAISNSKCPISLYIYCEDVDKFYKNAVAAGAKSVLHPENMPWNDRMCSLQDIDGYIWNFATHTEADLAKEQQFS